MYFFFFQAEDGIRDVAVTGVQTCALPISYWLPVLSKAGDRSAAANVNLRISDSGIEHPVLVDVTSGERDRKSTRLNSSHGYISYAVFCLKKKTILLPAPPHT